MSSLTVWIVEVRRYGGQWTTLPSTSHAKQADAERAANRAVISGWDETRVREYVAVEDVEGRITEAVSTERERCADDIRAEGWTVAVHNDYRIHGEAHTFWLFTRGNRCVKGEGRTDAEALNRVRAAIRQPPARQGEQ